MTKVKICGITTLEDALAALECGADMIGFNFVLSSPRYLSADAARSIIEQLPPMTNAVGVFANEDLDDAIGVAKRSGVTVVQFHGDEPPEYLIEARSRGFDTIKAFRLSSDFVFQSLEKYGADAILLDAFVPDQLGGTGKMVDWSMARTIAETHTKVYLAGGLTHENVADAIRAVRPHAVDVASGVEISPGKKDREKMDLFTRNAREA